MNNEDRIQLVSLVMLGEAVATITLSLAILLLYINSKKLIHILPVAASYIWLLVIATIRIVTTHVPETWVQWNVVGAFAMGDIGMLVLLSRSWPRRSVEYTDEVHTLDH